jgi:hypothetical protein
MDYEILTPLLSNLCMEVLWNQILGGLDEPQPHESKAVVYRDRGEGRGMIFQ